MILYDNLYRVVAVSVEFQGCRDTGNLDLHFSRRGKTRGINQYQLK